MARTPTTTTAPTGQIAPFGLRMLPEMKERIEAAAKTSGRSMNAEIVARLQASFEVENPMEDDRYNLLMLKMKAELLQHLYAEAGETIATARDAVEVLKAAGKWPKESAKLGRTTKKLP